MPRATQGSCFLLLPELRCTIRTEKEHSTTQARAISRSQPPAGLGLRAACSADGGHVWVCWCACCHWGALDESQAHANARMFSFCSARKYLKSWRMTNDLKVLYHGTLTGSTVLSGHPATSTDSGPVFGETRRRFPTRTPDPVVLRGGRGENPPDFGENRLQPRASQHTILTHLIQSTCRMLPLPALHGLPFCLLLHHTNPLLNTAQIRAA